MNKGDIIDGKYQIGDKLGKGGFGQVYSVTKEGVEYALKVCTQSDEESIKRFSREVRLMESIDHKNVIKVLDKNLEMTPPYFVMPKYKTSLDKLIPKAIGKDQVVGSIFLTVCKGVQAIHNSGIVHRDINPRNILLNDSTDIVICDLGLGKFEIRDSTVLTDSYIFMGTEGFAPPEFYQIGGTKNANYTSDVYQLGKSIYNVYTGESPISIDTQKLTGGLLYIVQKCTAIKFSDRFTSVPNLEDAINNYLKSLDPQNNPQNAFDLALNKANQKLKTNTYSSDNLKEIFDFVYFFKDDPELFFKQFNKIPFQIIDLLAANLPNIAKRIIELYTETTDKYINGGTATFSDADSIANRMQAFFRSSKDVNVKMLAVRNTLIAAYQFNRYHAMDIFDNMLLSTQDDTEAYVISEMLRENKVIYSHFTDRISKLKLHIQIQNLIDEIKIVEIKPNTEIDDLF